MEFKPKICLECGREYLPTGHYQKYCDQCELPVYKKYKADYNKGHRNKEYQQLYKEEHPEQMTVTRKKNKAKRRTLGFIPLNKPFDGCEAHHITPKLVVYIPKELHHSIWHDIWSGTNMDRINLAALNWITKETTR